MLLTEYDQSAVKLANAAWSQITKFNLNRKVLEPKPVPPSGILYHYTTSDGLKGIIEENELWATSAYFLNDSAEVTYGYQLLKEVLELWLADNPRPEGSLALSLARDLRKSFGDDLLNMNLIEPIYLACFCEHDNLLSQWRAYGQSGGYSLGFDVPKDAFTGQGFKPEPCTYTSEWVKVDYCRNEQIKKCRAVVDMLLTIFDNSDITAAIATLGEHPFFGYPKILTVIVDVLLEEIVGFKNEAFEVEKEWRIVVRRRELTKQGTDDGGKTPTPIHFRCSRGMVVPYVKLIPTDPGKKLPVACVRSGPTMDKTIAGMAVKMLLEKNGYPSVLVEGSDISVRFS